MKTLVIYQMRNFLHYCILVKKKKHYLYQILVSVEYSLTPNRKLISQLSINKLSFYFLATLEAQGIVKSVF